MTSWTFSEKTMTNSTIQNTVDELSSSQTLKIDNDEMRKLFYFGSLKLHPTEKEKIDNESDLNNECQVSITKLLEIPEYLSFRENKIFQNMIQQKISLSITSINIEDLGEIAILMHQSIVLKFEKSLWIHYLRSGTGELRPKESNLHIWPSHIRSMIICDEQTTTTNDIKQIQMNDGQYFKFVNKYLNTLNQKLHELQKELQLKKKQFSGYTIILDNTLQTFVQEHTQSLSLQYEYNMKMVEFNYREQMLEHKFEQENPSQHQIDLIKQLLHRKYDYEIVKQEVLWMKKQIAEEKFPKILQSLQSSLPSSIQLLTDIDRREQLSNRYHRVREYYKNEMITILLDTIESRLDESRTLFHDEITKFWQYQNTHISNECFNETMIDLIDRQIYVLTERVEYLSR